MSKSIFNDYVDKWGLVVQNVTMPKGGDGGDAIHRAGMIESFRRFYERVLGSARPPRS